MRFRCGGLAAVLPVVVRPKRPVQLGNRRGGSESYAHAEILSAFTTPDAEMTRFPAFDASESVS